MSDSANKLAKSRLAIVEHIHRRERRHDPRRDEAHAGEPPPLDDEPPPPRGAGWLGRVKHAVRMWWRYHPAHMAVDVAAPLMQSYARQHPVQLLAISAGIGAAAIFLRPWKLVSLTTLVVAIVKSSQLSSVVLSALSAADFEHDNQRPEWTEPRS
jgi:Flp pilus assembly protein TadB